MSLGGFVGTPDVRVRSAQPWIAVSAPSTRPARAPACCTTARTLRALRMWLSNATPSLNDTGSENVRQRLSRWCESRITGQETGGLKPPKIKMATKGLEGEMEVAGRRQDVRNALPLGEGPVLFVRPYPPPSPSLKRANTDLLPQQATCPVRYWAGSSTRVRWNAGITSSAKRCNCSNASDFGTPTERLTEMRSSAGYFASSAFR